MWENHCGRRELKKKNGGQCELNMVISPSYVSGTINQF